MAKRTTNPIQISEITLTPEIAAKLLARNPRNRKISRANYGLIRRAIENGEWELNGEAIKIGISGAVLDGQHRLLAVQDTGISIPTLLIQGIRDDAQDTMDTGKSRSLADILMIRGEVNGNGLAALIKRNMTYERHGMEQVFQTIAAGRYITNREALSWLDGNGWVREYVMPGRAVARHTPLGSSSGGFLLKAFDDLDAEDSSFFWSRISDGVELSSDSPIRALRVVFQKLRDDVQGERNQRYIAALTIKAWNAYRTGQPIRQLKFRIGGAAPESFPLPK